MNRLLKLAVLFILIVFVVINIKSNKGSFNDIIIERYPNKNDFNKLDLEKAEDDSKKIRHASDDSEVIKELLTYFQDLKVEKIDTFPSPEDAPSREMYEINFSEDDTYSKLKIEVLNDKYLRVLNYIYIRKYNKKENEISYDNIFDMNLLRIVDSKLDLDYIDRVFNSLKE